MDSRLDFFFMRRNVLFSRGLSEFVSSDVTQNNISKDFFLQPTFLKIKTK